MTHPHPLPAAVGAGVSERLAMTEAEFLDFYTLTARPLKSYLSPITGNPPLADDLLPESFYRLLRANLPAMEPASRKSYLYRIATNLARDHFRSSQFQPAPSTTTLITPVRTPPAPPTSPPTSRTCSTRSSPTSIN